MYVEGNTFEQALPAVAISDTQRQLIGSIALRLPVGDCSLEFPFMLPAEDAPYRSYIGECLGLLATVTTVRRENCPTEPSEKLPEADEFERGLQAGLEVGTILFPHVQSIFKMVQGLAHHISDTVNRACDSPEWIGDRMLAGANEVERLAEMGWGVVVWERAEVYRLVYGMGGSDGGKYTHIGLGLGVWLYAQAEATKRSAAVERFMGSPEGAKMTKEADEMLGKSDSSWEEALDKLMGQ